jgi:hypothetical protein
MWHRACTQVRRKAAAMKELEKAPNVLIQRSAMLEDWSDHNWTDGVQIAELKGWDTLVIETAHHTYEITIINPATAEVLIRGGELFSEQTPAIILGAFLRTSPLKVRGIYLGFAVEMLAKGKRIITSRVRRIARNPYRIANESDECVC